MTTEIKVGDKVTRKSGKGIGTVEKVFKSAWGPNTGKMHAVVKWHGSGVRPGNRSGGDRRTVVLVSALKLVPQEPQP